MSADDAPELARFDLDDAWALGGIARELAAQRGLGVAIDIRRATGMVLFRTALHGSTADQDDWIRRKAAVVFRFDVSSAEVTERLSGIDPALLTAWLDPHDHALSAGSVPIRVTGAGVVAALTVSGAASADDHRLAVDAIVRLHETQG